MNDYSRAYPKVEKWAVAFSLCLALSWRKLLLASSTRPLCNFNVKILRFALLAKKRSRQTEIDFWLACRLWKIGSRENYVLAIWMCAWWWWGGLCSSLSFSQKEWTLQRRTTQKDDESWMALCYITIRTTLFLDRRIRVSSSFFSDEDTRAYLPEQYRVECRTPWAHFTWHILWSSLAFFSVLMQLQWM